MKPEKKRRLLPRLWTGRRLVMCMALVAAGLAQAAGALMMSLSAAALTSGAAQVFGMRALTVLIASTGLSIALAILQARTAERFAATYVHDLRMRYVEHVMRARLDRPDRNIGHVLTRVVNDMSAIKSWLARGLVSVLVTGPMILTIGVWLWQYDPRFLPAVSVSILAWLMVTAMVWRPLGLAIRNTRKQRGNIAGFAGSVFNHRRDSLLNGTMSHSVRGLMRRSTQLTNALVNRAFWSAGLRSAGVIVFPVAIISHLAMGPSGPEPPDIAAMTSFLMIMAFVSAQLTVLSSGLEFYQSAQVAYEKIRAILHRPTVDTKVGRRLPIADWRRTISIDALPIPGNGGTLSLRLEPGSCHDMSRLEPCARTALKSALLGLSPTRTHVRIGEISLAALQLSDIWRRVKCLASSQPQDCRLDRLYRGSRLSQEKTRRVLDAFDIPDEKQLAEHASLRLRAAQIVLANPAIVIVDDPELVSDPATMRTFLRHLSALKTTVFLETSSHDHI